MWGGEEGRGRKERRGGEGRRGERRGEKRRGEERRGEERRGEERRGEERRGEERRGEERRGERRTEGEKKYMYMYIYCTVIVCCQPSYSFRLYGYKAQTFDLAYLGYQKLASKNYHHHSDIHVNYKSRETYTYSFQSGVLQVGRDSWRRFLALSLQFAVEVCECFHVFLFRRNIL